VWKQTDYRPIGCGGINAALVAAVCGCAFAWKVRWYSYNKATARTDGADEMYALYHTVNTTSLRIAIPFDIARNPSGKRGFTKRRKVPGLLNHLPGPSPCGKRNAMDIGIGIETNRVTGLFPASLSQSLGRRKQTHY
jgi:hypothetical protein